MKRKFFLSFLMACICLTAIQAGNWKKRYSAFPTENGMLYFIRPMHMPKCEGNSTKKGMTFDMTYLSNDDDSVSFTSTIVTNHASPIDSVTIHSNQHSIRTNIEQIYCEPHKNKYIWRIRYYITWTQWKELYNNQTPYIIEFEKDLMFSFHKKKWEKEKNDINNILQIIELNKKKK